MKGGGSDDGGDSARLCEKTLAEVTKAYGIPAIFVLRVNKYELRDSECQSVYRMLMQLCILYNLKAETAKWSKYVKIRHPLKQQRSTY